MEPTPFAGLVADDFDPQGAAPREENPDQVPNVLDGDPATSWTTSTYQQNFGPGGLKTGVGLVIDLGATKAVRRVVVTTEAARPRSRPTSRPRRRPASPTSRPSARRPAPAS